MIFRVVVFFYLIASPLYAEKIKEFYESIKNNDEATALAFAKRLLPSLEKTKVDSYSRNLFKYSGIGEAYFYADFNRFDYQRWENACFFWQVAQKAAQGKSQDDEVLEALLNAVSTRIEKKEPAKNEILWPRRIWELKKGLCDRQAWVFAEMAYQLRFETMLVYLWDKKMNRSPHTICEIRKGEKVWVVDVLKGKILSQISVKTLAETEVLKKKIWPKNEHWRKTLATSILFLPAYPQDYRPRNQELAKKINALESGGPRFGENPLERFSQYLTLCNDQDRTLEHSLWFWPVHLLKIQVNREGWKKKTQ